ncbi:related to lipase [Cephalotrichum gorgonifer]|uniref:sn-1-specific diacylglycerol lipase n=1 Tax=Cephalotrichum gorgonifer TaxID=2041049 RepID=A0AAE8N2Q2_9PEZI|nr:related to lipase [Cephalotrichum gorgonifer]
MTPWGRAGSTSPTTSTGKGSGTIQPVTPTAVTPRPGRTLLPGPIAQVVSFATRSTCFAIRAGSTVSSYGFDVAKIASLSSLELSRTVVEGLLSRTGRHVLGRSKTDLSREEAESILESSLASVHQTISRALFWTTAGFELTGSTISIVSDMSQLVLSSLDQFFGSTDSSRAIASIITLIRREFQNPATGAEGERVGVIDLVVGLSALSLLQRNCRKATEREDQQLGREEIIWDVVVVNDGDRVDVHAEQVSRTSSDTALNSSSLDPAIVRSIEEHGTLEGSDDEDLPEIVLKEQIMRSLPADTTVSISTSSVTTKTITVDVSGPEVPILTPPPGVEMIEKKQIITPGRPNETSSGLSQSPPRLSYRVVYQVARNKLRSTELRRCDDGDLDTPGLLEMGEAEEIVEAPKGSSPVKGSKSQPLNLSPPRVMGHSPRPTPREKPDTAAKPPSSNPPSGRSSPEHIRANASPGRTSKTRPSNTANQKRLRMPLGPETRDDSGNGGQSRPNTQGILPPKTLKTDSKSSKSGQKPTEKKTGLKQALRRGSSHALSSLWTKDTTPSGHATTSRAKFPTPTSIVSHTTAPSNTYLWQGSQRPASKGKESRVSLDIDYPPTLRRTPSYSSYISVHERCRDSIVSTTDTFSIHSTDDHRPSSPAAVRTESMRSRRNSASGGQDMNGLDPEFAPAHASHGRRAQTPSLYSIASNNSQTSLVLSSYYQRSAYANSDELRALRRTGMVEGTFPRFHLLRNITRYVRFSTASYGSSFMKYMGISKNLPKLKALDSTHRDIRSFVRHTQSTEESILLASIVDPQGGTDSTGSTDTGVPLVHYISLDHESKAVVLACRGTLGFEDVLADMTCDYDELVWRGRSYKVHKGIHASARRLLYGADRQSLQGKVLRTLKVALEEFEDYGLVLCGHSLGGGVTALLGVMLSEPNGFGTGFVTSSEPHSQYPATGEGTGGKDAHVCLPPGRPIHVYAYGPPGTMSSSLRKAARGLVTTVVQGNDLVPYLSLGVLHDLQAVALAFKNDSGAAKDEVRNQIWERFQNGLADRWYNRGTSFAKPRNSEWAVSLLRSMRATMVHEKLLPPGEVFVVETTRVLRRDAFVRGAEDHIGRPAKRAVLKYVKDVEARFGEARFGTSMLMDHSPGSYEDALNTLRLGVSGPEFGW